MEVAKTPDGTWTTIADGTLPDPIPLAENETQIPLDISELSPEVQTQVRDRQIKMAEAGK